jgi:hypothetical protein
MTAFSVEGQKEIQKTEISKKQSFFILKGIILFNKSPILPCLRHLAVS